MASSQAQVAKLCKQYVTSLGIKCKATSESFAGGTAVRVVYTDQSPATHKKIANELSKYQYGHFDGMTDSYEYSNSRSDIPQTKYMSIDNEFSAALKQRAWEYIRANYNTDGLSAVYSDLDSNARVRGMYVNQFMWQFLNGSIDREESELFWSIAQPPVARKPKARTTVKPNNATVEAVTVSKGTKEGYVEIRFPEKPSDEERTELKAAGFRWSRYNGCWWGKANTLPETYQQLN
jgi:hypothetical protein